MVKHIVMWKKTPQTDQAEFARLVPILNERFSALKSKITELSSIAFFANSPDADQTNYDICLICEFEKFADLNIYVPHPEHQEVVKIIKSLNLLRVCIDFEY